MIRFNPGRKVFSSPIEITGFIRNPQTNTWETSKLRVAARLRDCLDQDAKKIIDAVSCQVLEPWTRGLLLPPNRKLDPWQELGVRHILERNHSYIAFEQGIGKTPTAIAAINSLRERTLILCPPSLIGSWLRHFEHWSFKTKVEVYKYGVTDFSLCDVLLCADSLLDCPFTLDDLRHSPFRFLVVEEAHRFVNMTAVRTRGLFGDVDSIIPNGLVHLFDKATFLSGTPMPNRPIELFPILKACAANTIDYCDKFEFGIKWCGAYESSFGWRFDRSSNEEDLNKRLKLFMRREEKEGKGFAKKFQRLIYFDGKVSTQTLDLEKQLVGKRSLAEFVKEINDKGIPGHPNHKLFGALSRYRTAVGLEKVPLALTRVKEIMDEGQESVLLLGWHTEVLQKAMGKLVQFQPFLIHGKTKMRDRDSYIDRFNRGQTRLLIANIQTMVGFNIPKATRVVFMEFSWVPKDNEQAADRAHRRGSTTRVIVEFLLLTGTLEEYMLQTILKKRKVIKGIIGRL